MKYSNSEYALQGKILQNKTDSMPLASGITKSKDMQ